MAGTLTDFGVRAHCLRQSGPNGFTTTLILSGPLTLLRARRAMSCGRLSIGRLDTQRSKLDPLLRVTFDSLVNIWTKKQDCTTTTSVTTTRHLADICSP